MTLFLCALIVIYVLRERHDFHVRDLATPAAATLIVLALFLVLEPETRALLLLADYVGIPRWC
jgi:hypothetical protein